ncbi:Osmotin, thaumatin-like protein [Mollisia scopiformis]|uniref:Osmotin, thaumatin-like protein n=1 Tax=Mollisia scopiformis TaxID=149040 RepID=A0A194XU75_MOLSC|nr:Osmotin, thaumatin-like protein [Mollisia scopiformis]KUJ23589.1 Osmotin, thaumatin-like protein [Mollisia scopiformis]
MRPTNTARTERVFPPLLILLLAFFALDFSSKASAYTTNPFFVRNSNPKPRPARWGPPEKRDGSIPLVISNNCGDTIWPGIGTQAGTGAGTGGFELSSGDSKALTVSPDWQGRVWGRTNCSFNVAGTGASNLNGNNGAGAACSTGDCGGVLSCVLTGATPVTLAEFDLAGGTGGTQTFYDISLVDGYNIPLGITYIPGDSASLQDIPPNLTNPACIGTAGWLADPSPSGENGNSTNSTYPVPFESKQTNAMVASWCPWDLQVTQPTKPGDGVYPYPDDNIQRPIFDPCLSACSKTNSPSDCCTGAYDDSSKCSPNLYATSAKAVCPDAYSYAFDDQTSTFIIPSGGGWEITFCPEGRSTNILATFKQQLEALSQGGGKVSKEILADCMNITIINEGSKNGGERTRGEPNRFGGSLGALVVVVAWAVLW